VTPAGATRLVASLRPKPGAARELSFVVRPRGAQVLLSGTRGGRPLAREDVWLGASNLHPRALPAVLPDLDGEGDPFAPSQPRTAGVSAWLALAAGRQVIDLDDGARERLRALGYLGQ
jgi:hypothetical protein